jgi:3-deoxy-D-manno-octulosonic-acid transferase
MYALYSIALALAAVLGLPLWLLLLLFSPRHRAGISQRLGFPPAALRKFCAGHPTVWVHAVSVGEVLAVAPLVLQLRSALAGSEIKVVVSTTTRTGQQLARARFGQESVFYFPLDFRFILRRYFRLLNPALIVLVESEFWPNHLRLAQLKSIPVAVVNARISDRSLPRYLRLRLLWRRALSPISLFLAQSQQDADRLRSIGAAASGIQVSGNLKFDLAPPPAASIVELLRRHLPPGTPLLVCGSTMEGEEALLIAAHQALATSVPNLVTILAPRHPERFDAVARLLPDPSLRRSLWAASANSATPAAARLAPFHPGTIVPPAAPIPPGTIFLLDSIGELASLYSLASVAFIGGSLLPPGGGHNPLEPALFSVTIVTGPLTQNFAEIIQTLLAAHALTIATAENLAPTLAILLLDPIAATAQGRRAHAVLSENTGATARTLAALLSLLNSAPPAAASSAPPATSKMDATK